MTSEIEFVAGGVTTPAGFRAAAVGCGIKNPAKPRLDLAVLHSTLPCTAAGMFTTNKV